jgi:hypothetical protein
LLPGPGGEPGQEVLAPPRLVSRLRELARPAPAPTSGVVLVSGHLEGRLVKDRAEFTATWIAHALGEGPASLKLPLDGVQLLGDVLLDGARVMPTALAPPQGGYTIRVRGQGRHKVELRFQVSVTRSSDDDGLRQVRFGVPPVVQNRLIFFAPEGARHLRVPVKHGGVRVTAGKGMEKIEAELGAIVSPLLLRWNQESRPARTPHIEFREAYLWDLRAEASQLTALIRYDIRAAAVTSLLVDLPADLEVRSATARRPAILAGKGLTGEVKSVSDVVRLKDWTVEGTGAGRILKLEFPVPVSGPVEATLELVPRAPWAASVSLPLPRPHEKPAADSPSFLAYRCAGLEATRTNWLRLTGIPPAEFAPFWPGATRREETPLDYASSFRRDPRQPPELRLALRPIPPRLQALQAISVQVGPAQAELSARIDLVAPGGDLSLVEWEIQSSQPVTIASVTGPDVSRWSQSGHRLLIWLKKTTSSARLSFSGWMPLASAWGKKSGEPGRLELPCLRLAQPALVRTHLGVSAGPGLTLSSQGVKNLILEGTPRPGELHFTPRQPSYGGTFLVRPGPAPMVDIVTAVRLEGKEVIFASTITSRVAGEMRSLTVRLRDWKGEASLEAPSRAVMPRRNGSSGRNGNRDRSWTLELAPGGAGPFRVMLTGRMALEEVAGTAAMPEVIVPGAKVNQTLLIDESLVTEAPIGLDEVPAPTSARPGTKAWKVRGEDWSARLSPRRRERSEPVQVLLREVKSTVPDGRRWLHEARFWLRHEEAAELSVRWPAGVEILGVEVDGSPVPAREAESGRSWLSISGPGGIREVVFRYRHLPLPGSETLDRPDLIPPRLEGARQGPAVWTVEVPAGWEIAGSGGARFLGAGTTRRAVLELHRAEVALAICRELGSQRGNGPARAEAEARFTHSSRLAELALEAGAEGPALPAWLARLRKEHSALSPAAENGEIGRRTDEPVTEGLLPVSGTPWSWENDGESRPPMVRLVAAAQRETRQALAFSGQWLVLLLAVWTVALSRVLRTLFRWLWPELLALVGIVGWCQVGPTLSVLVLMALAVAGRLVLVARGLRGWSPGAG